MALGAPWRTVTGTRAALAVAALLCLAGCSGVGGVGTTREPLDVDGVDTATTPPKDPPPVIAFDPVADTAPEPFAIVEAHEDVLAGRSYTVDLDRRLTYANGTTRFASDRTTTFDANRSRFVQRRTATFGNDSMERRLYANGTHAWAWTSQGGENASVSLLTSRAGEPVPPSTTTVEDPRDVVLAGLVAHAVTDVSALASVPTGVDEPVFRVVLNRTANDDPYGDETLNSSVTLIVTEDGRIIEYHHEYAYVVDGVTVHGETRVQYQAIDAATVDRPDWVPENASGNASAPVDGPVPAAVTAANVGRSRSPTPTAFGPDTAPTAARDAST